MKQKLLLCCLLALLPAFTAFAYDFESDGIYYTITGTNTVSVVNGTYAYEGDINIPKTVSNGGVSFNVTAIGETAFKSATALENVTLPEGLTTIGNQAFYQSGVKARYMIRINMSDYQQINNLAFRCKIRKHRHQMQIVSINISTINQHAM